MNIGSSRSSDRCGLDASTDIFFGLKFHLFSIRQRAETFCLNGSLMDKDIFRSIVRDNETESLHGVEPVECMFVSESTGESESIGWTVNSTTFGKSDKASAANSLASLGVFWVYIVFYGTVKLVDTYHLTTPVFLSDSANKEDDLLKAG